MKSYTQIYLTDAEKNTLHDAAGIIAKIRDRLPEINVKTTDGKVEISHNDLCNVIFTLWVLEDSPMCESIEPEEDIPVYDVEPLNDIELDLT